MLGNNFTKYRTVNFMLRRQILTGALYVFCGAATAASSQSAEVMKAFFRKIGTEGSTYVLRASPLDATAFPSASKAFLGEFPVQKSMHRHRDFGGVSVRLMTDSEYIDIFANEKSCSAGWTEFHKRYPNSKALLAFSAVRFTRGGDEAHLLAEISYACLGGTIDRYRFVRHGSSWHFADSENLGRT